MKPIPEIYFTKLLQNKEIVVQSSEYQRFKVQCGTRGIKFTVRCIGRQSKLIKLHSVSPQIPQNDPSNELHDSNRDVAIGYL